MQKTPVIFLVCLIITGQVSAADTPSDTELLLCTGAFPDDIHKQDLATNDNQDLATMLSKLQLHFRTLSAKLKATSSILSDNTSPYSCTQDFLAQIDSAHTVLKKSAQIESDKRSQIEAQLNTIKRSIRSSRKIIGNRMSDWATKLCDYQTPTIAQRNAFDAMRALCDKQQHIADQTVEKLNAMLDIIKDMDDLSDVEICLMEE